MVAIQKGACDECGADGESLACICEREPVDNVAPSNRLGAGGGRGKAPRAKDARSGHVEPETKPGPKGGKSSGAPLPSAPQERYLGGKVICCRCRHIHNEGDRLNEWGKPAGKVMAGRRTECPKGCGYHVTVPYDSDVHGLPED